MSTTTRTNERLVATDISTGYGTTEIVHDVSIASRDGVTCVFGPNGSGKSTLMKALSGKLPVWSGDITIDGTDITDESIVEKYQRGVVQVPQDGGLFRSLTVHENLKLGGLTVDSERLDERIETIYERFSVLDEKRNQVAGQLSGGQQMSLSMGRAMVPEPSIYLLDEPSAGLSPALVEDLFSIVRELVDDGAQVVLIEQNIRSALRIADYVHILAQGRTQFEGVPSDLAEEEELLATYLGIR